MSLVDLAEAGHILDGHLDAQLERLAIADVDGRDRPRPPESVLANIAAAKKARDLVERALGGGESDALERGGGGSAQRLQPLQRERQVRAALAGDHGVDLVEDHPADRTEGLRGRWR